MKQYKIITAYHTAAQLSEFDLTDMEQWEVYKLRKFLRPHFEFQEEREAALRDKYSSFVKENGMLKEDKVQDFMRELNSIGDMDIEIEQYPKPQIKIVKGITCKIIEPLEDFIDFLPPDK